MMADLGHLDFGDFVSTRASEVAKGVADHGYCYVSDRETRAKFERMWALQLVVESAVRIGRVMLTDELLNTAVEAGPNQFSRAHAAVRDSAATLNIPMPRVFVKNAVSLNAMTFGTREQAWIVIHSAVLDQLDDHEVLAVAAHECGHVHNEHVVYLTAMHYLRLFASMVVKMAVAPAQLALNAWSRRAEVTCDRAMLMCTKDVDVATRTLAKVGFGSKRFYEQVDFEAFLAQYDQQQSGAGRFLEAFESHPWLPKRIHAVRKFAESALYRESVGLDGGLPMSVVDAAVADIVQIVVEREAEK